MQGGFSTPLAVAAQKGHLHVVQYLVEQNANVEKVNVIWIDLNIWTVPARQNQLLEIVVFLQLPLGSLGLIIVKLLNRL